ncbi:MAG: hypothetical protein ACLPYW_09280, partial [Acidimicrobiales bacterium]
MIIGTDDPLLDRIRTLEADPPPRTGAQKQSKAEESELRCRIGSLLSEVMGGYARANREVGVLKIVIEEFDDD